MSYIKWFDEISIQDVESVGGKNASLGEMYCHLTSQGVNIPNGFAITSAGYFYLLKSNALTTKIQEIGRASCRERVSAEV